MPWGVPKHQNVDASNIQGTQTKELHYVLYVYVNPPDNDENGSAPAKSGKKNCANPYELFSGCVMHHSTLSTFAPWTSSVTNVHSSLVIFIYI